MCYFEFSISNVGKILGILTRFAICQVVESVLMAVEKEAKRSSTMWWDVSFEVREGSGENRGRPRYLVFVDETIVRKQEHEEKNLKWDRRRRWMGGGDDPNSNSSITYRLSPDISVIPISCEKPSSHTKKNWAATREGKYWISFNQERYSSNLINISLSPIVLSSEKFDGFFSSKSSCQPLYNREECDSEKYPLWPSGLAGIAARQFSNSFPNYKK